MSERSVGSLGQLIRYGVVGIVSNATLYLLFLGITHLGLEHKTSMSVVYLGGASVGFLGNKQWTFSRSGHWISTGWRYMIAHCLGYLLNLALLVTFVDYLGYAHELVQAAAIFVVGGCLFVLFKFIVFAAPHAAEPEEP